MKLVVPGFGWAEAFVLGAILAPTDPVAAVAVMQRLRVDPSCRRSSRASRWSTTAPASSSTGWRSPRPSAARSRSWTARGSSSRPAPAASRRPGRRLADTACAAAIDDAPIEITLSLFTPYAAYIAAEAIGASGILAAVAAGLYLGSRGEGLFSATARIEAQGFWNALMFMLESTLFLLMGLPFR